MRLFRSAVCWVCSLFNENNAITNLIERFTAIWYNSRMRITAESFFCARTLAAPLMYQADRILSVKSLDLKTEFREGEEWTFDAAAHTILMRV